MYTMCFWLDDTAVYSVVSESVLETYTADRIESAHLLSPIDMTYGQVYWDKRSSHHLLSNRGNYWE